MFNVSVLHFICVLYLMSVSIIPLGGFVSPYNVEL